VWIRHVARSLLLIEQLTLGHFDLIYLSIYVCIFVRKIFYIAWIGNGFSNFDEIWQVARSWAVVERLGKLAKSSKIGTIR